jgi:tRNA G10  N-methylase Trm11
MKSICILGRQPALGLAELESLLGPGPITPLSNNIALLDIEAVSIPFSRLGGTMKLAKVLAELSTTDVKMIETYLHNTVPVHMQFIPEGKFTVGLSFYGFDISPVKINAMGIRLKKTIQKTGRSVRVVPNKAPDLNTAQVLHNNLTGLTGWELLLVKHGDITYLAQTTGSQDIEAYAARDQKRPQRDAKVGMLPPKLAQIIINMAADGTMPSGHTVLDPFCGTGVLLQEAALMGFDVYGTDIEPRMIEYSGGNLAWLKNKYADIHFLYNLEPGDATSYTWKTHFDTVACEVYLGDPLYKVPHGDKLQTIINDCDRIVRDFLKNLEHQTIPGQRLCLAVPVWFNGQQNKRLPSLDHLKDLGYNRLSFVHAETAELIYHRPGQIVGRELVALQRN